MTTPCRTMLVDDEPDMLALVAMQIELANHGLTVAGTAGSGEEALQLLPEAHPDVIVLDYRMPGADGLEVAARILASEPTQNIVLFSSYITDAMEAQAQRLGIRECVSKDRVKDLPEIIRKYCPAA